MRKIMVLSMCVCFASAQNEMDALLPFFGFEGSQSLQNSIGQATVTAGEIIPGLTSNPANLGLHRFSTLGSNFYNGKFDGNRDLSNSGFSGLYAILPIHVYQGSLVFGFGINKETSFSGAGINENYIPGVNDDYTFDVNGGMYITSFGAAIEFSKHLYIGADFKYLRGENELLKIYPNSAYPDSTDFFNASYRGFGASIGFLQKYTPQFQIGGSLELPTKLWVDDRWIYSDNFDHLRSFNELWEYTLKKPMVLHLGGTFNTKEFNLFYELEWTDFANIEFKSKTIFEEDLQLPAEIGINNNIKSTFESTVAHHIGAAVHLPMFPMHLYGGYQYLPVPYTGDFDDDKRESISAGFSFMLNQQFSLHGSWTNYFWKNDGLKENYSQSVFGVSLHY
ncbi:MAG: hypothetical protein HN367_01155 [Candidatus Marinimicrobia bacterium]|nr:hypothetical protein [Candidatus Neomarinimicrobiota bacterium]